MHVRREGDDPLDLAIVIDAGAKKPNDLAGAVAEGVAAMTAEALLLQATDDGLHSPKLGKGRHKSMSIHSNTADYGVFNASGQECGEE